MTDQAAWQAPPTLPKTAQEVLQEEADRKKARQAERARPLEERIEGRIHLLLEVTTRFPDDRGLQAAQSVEHLTRALANLRA